MTNVIKKQAEHLVQISSGASWENLTYANKGDGHAAYVYPKGKNNPTQYKPKTLVYYYNLHKDFFPNKVLTADNYKIDNLKFILFIGKYNIKANDLPSIQVILPKKVKNSYTWDIDDVGVPIKSYKRLANEIESDNYVLEFDLTDAIRKIPKEYLKAGIGIKVIWNKTKISEQSVISINRARIIGTYNQLNPRFSTYSNVSTSTCFAGDTIYYRVTVKNTGYRGTSSSVITFPKGSKIISHTGGGTWNNSNKTLSYTLDKGETIKHTFKLSLKNLGLNYIRTTNNVTYTTNANTVNKVSVIKKPVTPVVSSDDIITYYFPMTFANESSYFDVNIQGFKDNHPHGLACYTLYVPDNVVLDTPLRLSTELLDDNTNVDSIIRDESFVKDGITVEIADNSICLQLENDNDDFIVNLRFPIYCTSDDDATIRIDESSDLLEIYPMRQSIFDIAPSINNAKKYVQNSINIGSPEMWTIRAKASKRNFFDTKRELFEISIEKLIAYIGCVPLSRGHQADNEASVKNTLIENRHNNRAYYGKKGDFSEDIGMTLRLHPSDVATLEGLCELDKPIPIDTVPHIPDGDPLNHRGWAELHGVTGIKKINSFLYECQPEVTYLTHDLITRFGIDEGAKIATNNIEYFLGLTHDFGDSLRNYFNLNYYQFFRNVEDENGDYIGEYDLDPNGNLTFNSINKLSKRGNYDIKYRNILPALMSEDYDGNWSMSVRILDKANRTPLFEHSYDNFKHYDFNEQMVINECDVTTRLRDGDNFDIVNYDRLNLTYDGLASLTELRKTGTYLNKIETSTYTMGDNLVETFLYDKDDNPVVNGKVKVMISNNEGYYDEFYILSDTNGKIEFPLNLNNGRYTIKFVFEETSEYKGCEYTFSALVEYEVGEYHFDYPSSSMVINTPNAIYPVKLLDANNAPASGMIVYYSFKGLGDTNYSYESKLVTDNNGIVNIPINYTNGSKYLKVSFKGFIYNGTIYPSCYFETMLNINITGKDSVIEADDIELVHGDNNKIYNVILKDAYNNTPLKNKNVTIGFYNDKENYVFDIVTNDFGVATLPIYLGVGDWFVDIHFKGDDEYKPNVANKRIVINNFVKHDVIISSENLLLNENRLLSGEDDYYKITLKDEDGNLIANEPITFKVWDINKTEKYVDTILYSNSFGVISFPYVNHGKNVIIESYYEGSNRYNSSFNSDIVTFEQVLNKSSTEFSVDSSTVNCTQDGYTSDATVVGNVKGDFDVIVTYPNNNRLSDKGVYFAAYCEPNQTYYVTILHRGDDSHYAKCETLTFTPTNSEKSNYYTWGEQQVEHPDIDYNIDVIKKGEIFNLRVNFNFTNGSTPIYLAVGSTSYHDLEDLKENSVYVLKSKPIKYEDNDDYVEYVEFTGIMPDDDVYPDDGRILLYLPDTRHFIKNIILLNLNIQDGTRNKQSIIEQSGFGNNGETYQDVTISSLAADDPAITTNTNDYYIMKLFNNTTYEELFFYSYLDDIVTSTKLNFMLTQGDWDLTLIGSGNDTYKGDWYNLENVIIDVESEPVVPSVIDGIHNTVEVDNDLFFNDYNYTKVSGYDISIDDANKELDLLNSSFSYISPNVLPDYDYVLKHTIVSNDGMELFDYNTIDVVDGITNGVMIQVTEDNMYCLIKKDNEILFNQTYESAESYNIEYKIHGDLCDIFINNNLIYENYKMDYNTILLGARNDTLNVKNIHLYQNNEVVDEFTESVDTYEGKTFGSDIYFELKNNILNFIDYGMVPEGGDSSSKVVLNNIELLETDYELEIEIKYDNNTFTRLNNLEGYLRFRAYEDVSVTNGLNYSNILVSPVPIPDSITRFTRHTDEGTMYFVETPIANNKKSNLKYLCNPYLQYKGGTELTSETGISLFNLDNGISPVSLDNGLVKCEFHRRSGYVSIYRYDDATSDWYKCNTLKLGNNPQLELWKYTDDSCEIHFGETIWKMWRGRPWIQIQHPNDDLRILDLVDRVYCETVENEISMGFVEEHDTTMSVFDPKTSIQLFKEEWCIGENIKTDNFKLFNVINDDDVDYLNYNISLDTVKIANDKLLRINRSEDNEKIALNFPASPVYCKKPSNSFSLLIDNFKSYDLIDDVIVKCRGFDDKGCIHVKEGLQYGIWEDIQSVSLNGDYDTGETIRVSFEDVPDDVKYVDFLIIIPKADNDNQSNVLMNKIMLYEGFDIDISHHKDTSKAYAALVEINFNETYYANLYDEDSPCGLGIIRAYKESFGLRNLRKAKETVLVPFMKKSIEWDKPENVLIEYFNSKEQIVNIDWRD